MKRFGKSFVNKIVASVLILMLLMDTLPFTAYAVDEGNTEPSEVETAKSNEPDATGEDGKDSSNEVQEEIQVEEPEVKETQKETQTEAPETKETQTEALETQATQEKESTAEEIEIKTEVETEIEAETETEIETEIETEAPTTEEAVVNESINAVTDGENEGAVKHEVTVSKEGEGKIEIGQEETLTVSVEEGKSVEITMTPDDGCMGRDRAIGIYIQQQNCHIRRKK